MTARDTLWQHQLRLRAAYMKGWDSALISPNSVCNPYSRRDFHEEWRRGRRDCLANKPLPEWAKNAQREIKAS